MTATSGKLIRGTTGDWEVVIGMPRRWHPLIRR